MIRKSILLISLLVSTAVQAVEITWQSNAMFADFQSDGVTPIDSSFEFEIGQFENGFVPTAANVVDWRKNWNALATTQYDEDEGNIRGKAELNNNDVFQAGDPHYIWGFNVKTGPNAEWILLKDSEWAWPQTQGLVFPYMVDFIEPTGDEVILGEANTPSFQIKTAQPQFSPYELWVQSTFSESDQDDPLVSGPQADPDGDGRVNLLEFAAGTDPNSNDGSEFVTVESVGGFIDVEVNRAVNTGLNFSLLESSDLVSAFSMITPDPVILIDEPNRLVFRVPQNGAGRSFFRVMVEE